MLNANDQQQEQYTYVRWSGISNVVTIGVTSNPIESLRTDGGIEHRYNNSYHSIDVVKLIKGDVVKDLTDGLEKVKRGERGEFHVTIEFADKLSLYKDANLDDKNHFVFWGSDYKLDRKSFKFSEDCVDNYAILTKFVEHEMGF